MLNRALLSGRLTEMQRILSEMVNLLEPLRRDNVIAQGVLNDVLRKALAERVTADFLDRAYELLQKSVEQKDGYPVRSRR